MYFTLFFIYRLSKIPGEPTCKTFKRFCSHLFTKQYLQQCFPTFLKGITYLKSSHKGLKSPGTLTFSKTT